MQMGLGKTVQTIAFLAHLWSRACTRPHLVIVPLSTMRNWEREFALWAPQLNVVALSGNADARKVRAWGACRGHRLHRLQALASPFLRTGARSAFSSAGR